MQAGQVFHFIVCVLLALELLSNILQGGILHMCIYSDLYMFNHPYLHNHITCLSIYTHGMNFIDFIGLK